MTYVVMKLLGLATGEANHLRLGGVVVFPADGIGTGLASLPSRAPKIWISLCVWLETIGVKNGGH